MKSLSFLAILFLFVTSSQCFAQQKNITYYRAVDSIIIKGNDTIYNYPDSLAAFPGGRNEMNKFISNHLNYPYSNGFRMTGTCYLQFIVDAEGLISNITVLRGASDCKECDQEAISVVQSMPKWIPAKVDGKPVKSYFHLPVNFTLY